jgi:hypothetical protein
MIVSEMGQNDPFQDKINKQNNKIVVSDSGLALFLHFEGDFLIVQHTLFDNKEVMQLTGICNLPV